MDYKIGDKIICIDISDSYNLEFGKVYTIKNIRYTLEVHLTLEGLDRFAYAKKLFIPYNYRKEKINNIMTKLKQKQEEATTIETYYTCIDCDWCGETTECAIEEEWNEFRGTSMLYPVCPKCGGTVES